MQIVPGRVDGGRDELDAELPEGASVTVSAPEGDETFRDHELTTIRRLVETHRAFFLEKWNACFAGNR